MSELVKYGMRFGIVAVLAFALLMLTQGGNAVKIIAYKVAMVSVAVGLAELIWLVYFKPVYGRTEDMGIESQKGILVFRGILYAAIVFSLSAGL